MESRPTSSTDDIIKLITDSNDLVVKINEQLDTGETNDIQLSTFSEILKSQIAQLNKHREVFKEKPDRKDGELHEIDTRIAQTLITLDGAYARITQERQSKDRDDIASSNANDANKATTEATQPTVNQSVAGTPPKKDKEEDSEDKQESKEQREQRISALVAESNNVLTQIESQLDEHQDLTAALRAAGDLPYFTTRLEDSQNELAKHPETQPQLNERLRQAREKIDTVNARIQQAQLAKTKGNQPTPPQGDNQPSPAQNQVVQNNNNQSVVDDNPITTEVEDSEDAALAQTAKPLHANTPEKNQKIHRNLEHYETLAHHLLSKSNDLDSRADNIEWVNKLEKDRTSLLNALTQYQSALLADAHNNYSSIYGRLHLQSTRTKIYEQEIETLDGAITALKDAGINIQNINPQAISDENKITRYYSKSSNSEAKELTDINQAVPLIQAHFGAEAASQSPKPDFEFERGQKPTPATSAKFQHRFIPTEVTIKEATPRAIIRPKNIVAKVGIVESVNPDKTYSKQAIYADSIAKLVKADPSKLAEFAKELVNNAQASVGNRPFTINDKWPVKVAAAMVWYCRFKGYTLNGASKKAIEMAANQSSELRQHWLKNHPNDKSAKELATLGKATDIDTGVHRRPRGPRS